MVFRNLIVIALMVSFIGGSFAPVAQAQGYTLTTEVGGLLGASVESAAANTESAAANTETAGSTGLSATISNVLNGIAWDVAKMALQAMTNSIVNWINSGFNGSPAFETDLKAGMRQLADLKARQFFDELSTEMSIQSPFLENVAYGVGIAYYAHSNKDRLRQRLLYTLKKYTPDDRAFLQGDFAKGGFNAWFAAWTHPQNNPIGASYIAGNELSARIETEIVQRAEELAWGRGILSWRGDCLLKDDSGSDLGGSQRDSCAQYEIVTPGTYTENLLGWGGTSPMRQLELADSVDEIVGALVVQLVTKALEGDGLRGLSKPGSGGGKSPIDQAGDTSGSGQNGVKGIENELNKLKKATEEYKSNWAKIKTAADTAQVTLNNRSCKDEDKLQIRVTDAITRANDATTVGNTALAKIDEVMKMLELGGDRGAALTAASEAYIALLSSGNLVSTAHIAAAKTQANDTGEQRPGSLYSQMNRIALNCDEPPKY